MIGLQVEDLINIEKLKKLNSPEFIAITKHAKDRMYERGICVDDVNACIGGGEIIKQYEDDTPLPSCLIVGPSVNGKLMHIVASHDGEFIYLITAYYPDPEIWDSDFRNRKER